ncbi:MAG: glycoside hydrolase family 88 protein [Dysgonamonadaceae bacterium]|nr:glycoside hydrolase family 88 protein [Dysgonamonadaceae bacterium]
MYNQGEKSKYWEASASSMFTYAYLKGIRLGILDKKNYVPVAEKAYRGLIHEFIRKNQTGGIDNYYLCGKDVAITQNEGKAIGAFILASLEFEMNTK